MAMGMSVMPMEHVSIWGYSYGPLSGTPAAGHSLSDVNSNKACWVELAVAWYQTIQNKVEIILRTQGCSFQQVNAQHPIPGFSLACIVSVLATASLVAFYLVPYKIYTWLLATCSSDAYTEIKECRPSLHVCDWRPILHCLWHYLWRMQGTGWWNWMLCKLIT